MVNELFGGASAPVRFRGESTEGYSVCVEGGMSLHDSQTDQRAARAVVVYGCGNAAVITSPIGANHEASVTFALVNLLTHWEHRYPRR